MVFGLRTSDGMGRLQDWMIHNDLADAAVASRVGISRVHVCRIRNGLQTSVKTAKKLEKLTGIKWPLFVDPKPDRRKRGG